MTDILHWGELLLRGPQPPNPEMPPHRHQFAPYLTRYRSVGGELHTLAERRCAVCGYVP